MFGMFGFKFLEKVIANGGSSFPSTKRWALVSAMIFMGFSLLILSVAYVVGASVAAEVFWAFTIPMSLMAGVSYSSVEIAKAKALTPKPPVAPEPADDETKQ